MPRRRRLAVLAGTLLAAMLAVQPAAAFEQLKASGRYYPTEIQDDAGSPGVICIYNDRSGSSSDTLARIKVKRFFTHAPYDHYANVGFVLLITRNTPPYDDNDFRPYRELPMKVGKANQEFVAFFKATWTAPANVTGRFRAIVKLFFYKPNSNTIGGRLRGRFEAYQQRLGSTDTYVNGDLGDPGYCNGKYLPPN